MNTVTSADTKLSRLPSVPAAAMPGDALADVDTPSLILDLDAFEDNLRTMQVLTERHGVALRPHAKAHRCPDIALRQIALGAQGICCQKVTEALCFVEAGIRDIHISNEVVGDAKLSLLAQLAGHASLTVCVDNLRALQDLSAALLKEGTSLGVLVELDIGQGRCGVQDADEAIVLAQAATDLPQVSFEGVQAYHGGIQHKKSHDQRRKASEKAVKRLQRYLRALAGAGFECRVVTGGGTGTAVFDVDSGVYTEVQPGSYAFMDSDYGRLDWGEALVFRHSLFLLGTVMSVPTPERAVLDLGLKSTSAESGVPRTVDAGVVCTAVNDEHVLLEAESSAQRPSLGSQVRLIPGHCDPTFNLHDTVVAVRGQKVEAIWPITARGQSR